MLKRKKFKTLSLALTLALTLSNLTGLGGFSKVKAAAGDKVFNLVEITDFHGQLLSSDATPLPVGAVLAKNIKDIKDANPNRTLVFGGGDLYQGTPLSNVLQGVPVQKVLNNIGMEVTALGNHEFDWNGLNTIKNVTMKDASYSIICSNLYDKTTNQRAFAPYKIITKDKVRIALIGAITTESPSIIMPAFVQNYEFRDPVTEIKAVSDELKANNQADVILAVIHEGNDVAAKNPANGPITGPINTIANDLTGYVSAVFGGHAHTEVHAMSSNGQMPIYIAKSNGKGIINVQMTVSSTGTVSFPAPSSNDYISLENPSNPNGYKIGNPNLKPGDKDYYPGTPIEDSEVKAIIDAANKDIAPTFNVKIGEIPANLTRTQLAAPYGESQLGNWASDVIKNSAKADIGVANNGGLRCDFSKGDITVGQVFNFAPFDNEINTVKVNYAQLKAILEQAVMDGGNGIQVSGIKFYYDPARPNLDRVYKITKEDGSPITGTLTIAGPDFVLTGGDKFTAFTDSAVKATLVATHVLARDAFLADVRANKTIKVVMDDRIVNAKSPVTTISIVGTSDVHGAIYPMDYNTGAAANVGLARVSTYMNGLRAANPNTMLIDNGDTIQGTPLVYYYNMIDQTAEYPMMKVMGAMGYDSWTLGNHEFNYGLTTLNRIIKDASKEGIDVLSANIYNTSDKTNFVKPYVTKNFTVNGKPVKVGVLGLTTKTVPSWEDPAHYAGLQFNDLVDEAKKWVPVLKNTEKCDYVIVSAHSGVASASDVIPENQVDAVAKQVSGIDAILAGHTHTGKTYSFTNPDGKVVPVVEPKNGDGIISQIDLNFDADGNLVNLLGFDVTLPTDTVADPAILALAKPYQDATLAYTNTVIGQSTDVFEGSKQLTEPSSIMELVNKVQMDGAKAQLSIAAPLSLSAKVPKGDIKRQDIMGVYVFENFLFGVNMTGKQLKNWMEWSVRYYKQTTNPNDSIVKDPVLNIADYNLDQLFGATYDIDLTQPACTTDAKGLVTSGNRIKNLKVNGKLVKDTDVFKVAINNYRYNGGGGFMAAAGLTPGSAATIAATYYDSAKALGDDGQVRNMMFKYVQDNKTITPTNANNWKIYTTAVTQQVDQPQVVDNKDSASVVTAVKNAAAGSKITVDIAANSKVSKDIFNAIKGQDKTIVFQRDGVTWSFNGKDITSDVTADIDLSLKTVSAELKNKEEAKIKAVVGKDVAIVPFSFNYDGPLPGTATVKVFIGKDWANKAVYINRYYADKNTYEIITDVTVDADGYITFTTNHCSDYFVMEKSAAPSLPKTGSPIDFAVMLDLGALIAVLGGALMVTGRRKRDNEAV